MSMLLMKWLRLVAAVLPLAACSFATVRSATDPWAEARQADGSVVWLEEYRFEPPPAPWQLIDLNDRDVSVAFYKICVPASTACEATIAYAEEPFGSSRDLGERARQFFRRHLWASRVKFAELELSPTVIDGGAALTVLAEGVEPVSGQKVLTKVHLRYRGERVVAFFMNQWRGPEVPFDPAEFASFDSFVASFRFLGPSFYERL